MKYKNLTKEQIIISLDRLTRFKYTKDKFLRVYSDILTNCLIEPHFSKNDILGMDYSELTSLAETIFIASLNSFPELKSEDDNNNLSQTLRDYENSIFYNDAECQKLLSDKIFNTNIINLIDTTSPINLKWLKVLATTNNSDMVGLREKYSLKFPIEKVVLAEGITEEILLPAFSRYLGFDFYQKGIQIIPAGGKNQVVKMYYKLTEELKLPIFILLDKDAEENIKQITPKLRKKDKIHLVSCGEFEDLLPKSLIIKTVNNHFENFLSINESDLISNQPTAKVLEELFKTKGLHEFKKAEFAKLVRENINDDSDISTEIRNIVKELAEY